MPCKIWLKSCQNFSKNFLVLFYTERQSGSLILISKCLTRPTECVTNIQQVKSLHANGETELTCLCYVNIARAMDFYIDCIY